MSKLVRDLGNGWCLRRWEYDESPMELHGPQGVVLELKQDDLELTVTYTEYSGYSVGGNETDLYRTIPITMLKALLETKP